MNDKSRRDALSDRIIKDVMDGMGPTDMQKEEMWSRIESAAVKISAPSVPEAKSVKPASRRRFFPRAAAIAAAVILVAGGIAWFSAVREDAPGVYGHVYAAESRVTDMSADEVLIAAGDPAASGGMYIYAPAVYYADSQHVIFGNGAGLIIYNSAYDKVDGLIDMQAICSSYYNTDSITTHVMVDGDSLIVYNTKDENMYEAEDEFRGESRGAGSPWGFYHKFDLSMLPGDCSFLTSSESGNDRDVINEFIRAGEEYEREHLTDAWDNVSFLRTEEMDDAIGYKGGSYTELAYSYDDAGGKTSCLIISLGYDDEAGYLLYKEKAGSGEYSLTPMNLGITDEKRAEVKEKNALPAYTYGGDDPAMKAVCEHMAGDNSDEDSEGVVIPVPVIYERDEQGDELLVFGSFDSDSYVRQGNTMISVSGGRISGCYHLRKNGDGYEVASVEYAEDGELYDESIKKMTTGHPGLYTKFMKNSGNEVNEKLRKEAIHSYVERNELGIEYYKDYGWDPVKLN